MVVENLRVDVTPGGVPLVIHVSQYDAGLRQFVFTPYDKGVAMAKIAGATVAVEATKPDGYAVQHPCTYNNDGTITYTLQEQLAACDGQVWSKLTWRDSNGNILGAKAIVWAVDMAGIEDGAIVSDSDLPLIEQAAEFAGEYEQKVAEMIAEMQIVPGQVVIDGTLTVQGAAADAKATGDRLADLQSAIEQIEPGLSNDAKVALLDCFAHVAWADESGVDYYATLRSALYGGHEHELVSITAVFAPGSHEVYTTDSIESLRHFLTVTGVYGDQTSIEVTDYTLSGDISSTGVKTITVAYQEKTTTFTVTVLTNSTGILYEWDFTKGATDLRQNKGVRFLGHSASLPYVDNSGLHFDAYGEGVVLFDGAEMAVNDLANKTIQIDVASFVPGNTSYHTRLLMMRPSNLAVWNSGVVYRTNSDANGWNVYAGDNGWGTRFTGMSNRNVISGHTVGVYINSNKQVKLYLDTSAKGTQTVALANNLIGLMLGNHEAITNGATFFTALVTGVRVYSGEVA